jgi:hypothetical protein
MLKQLVVKLGVITLLTFTATSLAAAQQAPAAAAQPAGEPSAERVGLKLISGTIIVGTIDSETKDAIVIDAGPLGKITVKTEEVAGRVDPTQVAAVGAPPPPPAAAPPPSASIFAPPGQVRWNRTIDFQGSFNSAVYEQGEVIGAPVTGKQLFLQGDQYTAMAQLSISRTSNRHLVYLNGGYQLAVYEPQGTVMEMPTASFGYSHRRNDTDSFFYTARYEWFQDKLRRIDKSHKAFVGVGVHAKRTPKVQIDLVPLVGGIVEDKGTEYDNELLLGGGAVWQLTWKPNPIVTIDHRETFAAAFTDFDYRSLESYLGFRGMVGSKFGLTVGLTHMYDKALESTFLESPALPGARIFANKTQYIKLTTGIHIGF